MAEPIPALQSMAESAAEVATGPAAEPVDEPADEPVAEPAGILDLDLHKRLNKEWDNPQVNGRGKILEQCNTLLQNHVMDGRWRQSAVVFLLACQRSARPEKQVFSRRIRSPTTATVTVKSF
jgi:hypothetical protein